MKWLFFLMTTLLAFPLVAGEQTLLSGHIDHGGYGGPVFKYTQLGPNSEEGLLVGGQGGWIIDHTFVLGGAGFGLANSINANWIKYYVPQYLNFGYGGLFLAYINNSDKLIHYDINTIIGWGTVNYRDKDYYNLYDTDDSIFIVEPGIYIVANITKFFRVGAGASYRFVQGVEIEGLTDDNLSGPSAQVILKFGAF